MRVVRDAVLLFALASGLALAQGDYPVRPVPTSKQVSMKQQEFTAIPYYAWANRGSGEMTVWLPKFGSGCDAGSVSHAWLR